MLTSEKIDKIMPAYLSAREHFLKVTKGAENPFFKSKYADLNAYLGACETALLGHKIAIFQDTTAPTTIDSAKSIQVSTRLVHESGQWLESDPTILYPQDMKPQSFGSAQTYARRYNLSSFLGMGAEDDDGNTASQKGLVLQPLQMEKPEFQGSKYFKKLRGELNQGLLKCKTMDEYNDFCGGFQEKYEPAVWDFSTKHKPEETFSSLAKEHKARLDKPTVQDEWREFLSKTNDMDTYKQVEDIYNEKPILQTPENLKLLNDKKAFIEEGLTL